MQSLGENLNDMEIKSMMAAADENNDGRISFEGFFFILQRNNYFSKYFLCIFKLEEFDSMIKQGLKIKGSRDETRLNVINSSIEDIKLSNGVTETILLWPHLAP